MTHASLFSGIGGPEVAAAMMGWENAFHCEINPFGRAVLDYWFPESKSYEDITKTSFKEWRGRIDVLTGGFPCQPFSYAGKRGGRNDDRYLWPEMLRVIGEVRPTWVVGENVAGITTMVEGGVLTPLGGGSSLFAESEDFSRYELDQSFTIERICKDLEQLGYSVQSVLVPAAAVSAPHRRDRVFIIAHDDAHHTDLRPDNRPTGEDEGEEGEERIPERDNLHLVGDASEVRSEGAGTDTDTVCDGRTELGAFGVHGGRDSRPGDSAEREVQVPASDSNSHPRRAEQDRGREEGLSQGQEGRGILGTAPRPCGERTLANSPCELCDGDGLGDGLQPRTGSMPELGDRGGEDAPSDSERGGSGTLPAPVHTGVADGDESLRDGCVRDVAHTDCTGREEPQFPGWETDSTQGGAGIYDRTERSCRDGNTTDSVREGLEGEDNSGGEEAERMRVWGDVAGCDWKDDPGLLPEHRWAEFPTVPPIHRGNDGIPFPLDNLTIPQTRWRTESLKAYGNAIVPQVMYRIFQAIETAEKETTNL